MVLVDIEKIIKEHNEQLENEEKLEIMISSSKSPSRCQGCGKRKETQSIFIPYATSIFALCDGCKTILRNKLEKD